MSAIVKSYIRFYNDPIKFEYQRKQYKRYKQKKGLEPMGVIDVNLVERDEEDRGDVSIEETEAGYEIVLKYLTKFDNKEAQGVIDFGFKTLITQNYNETENRNHWTFDINFAKKANLIEFECNEDKQKCSDIRKYMEYDLSEEIFTIERGVDSIYN